MQFGLHLRKYPRQVNDKCLKNVHQVFAQQIFQTIDKIIVPLAVYIPHFGHQKTFAVTAQFWTIPVDTQFLGNEGLIGLEPYPHQSHSPARPEDQDQEKVGKKGSHRVVNRTSLRVILFLSPQS